MSNYATYYQAIIFDMDGTIVQTDHIWNQVSAIMLANRNIRFDETIYEIASQCTGISLKDACIHVKKALGWDESIEELEYEARSIASLLFDSADISLINGFTTFFQNIVSGTDLKIALATNSPSNIINVIEKKIKLHIFFGKHIYHIDHVNNIGKPNPALYLFTAQQLNVDPGRCIAIEDSASGIAAAKTAGMFCIGINPSNQLNKVDADILVNNYSEINLRKILTNPSRYQ